MNLMIGSATLDSGNLGLSALCHSMAASLKQRLPEANIMVVDNGIGVRKHVLFSDSGDTEVLLVGLRDGKKIWLKENVINVKFWQKLGIVANDVVKQITSTDFFLDISGGDSFTDLYGARRFEQVTYLKRFFSDLNVPLILMPQTYGPFIGEETRVRAGEYAKSSIMAWARDKNSFEVLKSIVGDDFNEVKYQSGVDMAFLLPMDSKLDGIDNDVVRLVMNNKVAGINVSGLIYNSPENATKQYGFKADYNKCLIDIVSSLVREEKTDVVLLPHVQRPVGHYESDLNACLELYKALDQDVAEHVHILPDILNEVQIKKVISNFSWFMGTRMHATIAALSSATAVATISYSDKAKGVFESCGVGDYVFDPRVLETEEVIQSVLNSYKEKETIKLTLEKNLPAVKEIAASQVDKIAEMIRVCSEGK